MNPYTVETQADFLRVGKLTLRYGSLRQALHPEGGNRAAIPATFRRHDGRSLTFLMFDSTCAFDYAQLLLGVKGWQRFRKWRPDLSTQEVRAEWRAYRAARARVIAFFTPSERQAITFGLTP